MNTRFCDAHSHWTRYLKLKRISANRMNELPRLNGPPRKRTILQCTDAIV